MVGASGREEERDQRADGLPERFDGAFGLGAQQGFQLGESHLD